jgi:hypothetical protein
MRARGKRDHSRGEAGRRTRTRRRSGRLAAAVHLRDMVGARRRELLLMAVENPIRYGYTRSATGPVTSIMGCDVK